MILNLELHYGAFFHTILLTHHETPLVVWRFFFEWLVVWSCSLITFEGILSGISVVMYTNSMWCTRSTFFFLFSDFILLRFVSFEFWSTLKMPSSSSFQVRIHSILEKTKKPRRKKIKGDMHEASSKEMETLHIRVKSLMKRQKRNELRMLIDKERMEPWSRDAQAKVCNFLLLLLVLWLMIIIASSSHHHHRHHSSRMSSITVLIICRWGYIYCSVRNIARLGFILFVHVGTWFADPGCWSGGDIIDR